MKYFIFFLLLSFNVHAQIQSGTYVCKEGNEESICDQILKPIYRGNELTAISVEYSGWCGSQGPYRYYCSRNQCSDQMAIFFEFRNEKEYRWENRQYGFYCKFKLSH